MRCFDQIIVVDWSAAGPGPLHPKVPPKDRIYFATPYAPPRYMPTRSAAEAAICAAFDDASMLNRRVLMGMDVGFGLPQGVTKELTGEANAPALWALLAKRIKDHDTHHNAFEVAAQFNDVLPGEGPFWGRLRDREDLPPPKRPVSEAFDRLRVAERCLSGQPKSMFQLAYAGAVGAQSLLAMAMFHRLKYRFGKDLAIWPFDQNWRSARVVLVELYLSMVPLPGNAAQRARVGVDHVITTTGTILPMLDTTKAKDPLQVGSYAAALAVLHRSGDLSDMLDNLPERHPWREEGWILGVNNEALLAASASLAFEGT